MAGPILIGVSKAPAATDWVQAIRAGSGEKMMRSPAPDPNCYVVYSVLSAFVGLAVAARIDSALIVNAAKMKTASPAIKKRAGLMVACSVKFCCHV